MSSRMVLSVVVFRAQDKELENLAKRTGQTKSELMREALTILINMHRKGGKND